MKIEHHLLEKISGEHQVHWKYFIRLLYSDMMTNGD